MQVTEAMIKRYCKILEKGVPNTIYTLFTDGSVMALNNDYSFVPGKRKVITMVCIRGYTQRDYLKLMAHLFM